MRSRWPGCDAALDRARGKLTMAILGHPFYAGGNALTAGYDEFAELKQLLLEHDVTIVMAGDTHDLEYYLEPRPPGGADSSFREWRRRRLSQLRHVARVARRSRRRRTGRSTPTRPRSRRRSRPTRRGGSGPPGGGPSSSAPGRSPPSGSRRCSTTTSRRSFRASSRCASSHRRTAFSSGPTAFMAGSRGVTGVFGDDPSTWRHS